METIKPAGTNGDPFTQALEPGMLRVFRLYAWLQMGSKVFLPLHLLRERAAVIPPAAEAGAFSARWLPPDLRLPALVTVLHLAVLFALLYWPWAQRKLGTRAIPLTLVVTTLGLVIEQHLFLREGIFWQSYPFLSLVVILIAWQYNFRIVAGFTLLTAALLALLQILLPAPMMVSGGGEGQRIPMYGFLFSLPVTFMVLGYVVSLLAAAQRKQRRTLAEANQKLVSHAATLEQLAISRERMRLSRELHDTLAHTLSAMAVQLEALQTVTDGMQPKARRMLDQIQAETSAGLNETRRALAALRASPLEDLGLPQALAALAKDAANRAGMALELEIPDDPDGLDDLPIEVEEAFYRVAQEALTNAGRHARAQRLEVRLCRISDRLALTIRDDGEGFAVGQPAGDRFGLRGMRERAEVIAADLTIASQPGCGTTVSMSWEAQP